MAATAEDILLEKYRSLPPQRRAEAEDFIDFLRATEARAQAADRLGKAFEKLDALNLPPMSAQDVQAEIEAARQDRRARNADRR